jgi:hypothetical protein
VAGEDYVKLRSKTTGAEDFSFFAQKARAVHLSRRIAQRNGRVTLVFL